MLERAITFFNARSIAGQAVLLIGGGIALHWLGMQAGGLLAALIRLGS